MRKKISKINLKVFVNERKSLNTNDGWSVAVWPLFGGGDDGFVAK